MLEWIPLNPFRTPPSPLPDISPGHDSYRVNPHGVSSILKTVRGRSYSPWIPSPRPNYLLKLWTRAADTRTCWFYGEYIEGFCPEGLKGLGEVMPGRSYMSERGYISGRVFRTPINFIPPRFKSLPILFHAAQCVSLLILYCLTLKLHEGIIMY